ncbi:SDR family oxidoreductase [Pseudomaricurvus alkylphenolicus]|uniref:SDR family oxidoreductase n=1 Tax=Pseudomaricurvus alkylphenolicus TaxID=1306991 RepID=UPI00142073F8|nr:SDR family oxidoreductase [Pseudomaricurvus alkylphenolicus]
MLMSGKVVLVAGVGPGMGTESALALARNGADLVLAARRNELIERLATEIEQLGRRVVYLPTDVCDADSCQRLVTMACEAFGGIDVLVYNAFYQGEQSTVMMADLDDWRKVLDVNLLGAVTLCQKVVPAMRGNNSSIIMVNSQQAWQVEQGFASYSASKGALENVTRHLASELGPQGIRVNGIHPGTIMGDALKNWFTKIAEQQGCTYQEIYDKFASQSAMNYIPDAREMAGTVVYLASELGLPITGQSIGINAGSWFH